MNFIGYLLFSFIWWMLLLPVSMIMATPFILVLALRGAGSYFRKVAERYAGVMDFWRENAGVLSP
mgnify:CR=1 FL=1